MLSPVLDPLHRPFELDGRPGNQKILRVKFPARTETPANIRFNKMNAVFRAIKQTCENLTVEVRHLGGAPNSDHFSARVE